MFKKIILAFAFLVFLTNISFAAAEDLKVGYYSNLAQFLTQTQYSYADPWYKDFSNTVTIKLLEPDAGTLEVMSSTLDPNTEITLTGPNGVIKSNECQTRPFCKQFYLKEELIAIGGEFTISIEAQPDPNNFHSVFVNFYDDNPSSNPDAYIDQALNTVYRQSLENNRTRLNVNNELIDYSVKQSMRILAIEDALFSTVYTLRPGNTVDDYSKAYQLMEAATECALGASGEVGWESALYDIGSNLLSLSIGDPLPAYHQILQSFTQMGILIGGIWDLAGLEEDVTAVYLAEETVRKLSNDDNKTINNDWWSDGDLIAYMEANILPEFENINDCSFFSDIITSCAFDNDYDQAEYIKTFRAFQKIITDRAEMFTHGNKYVDVDGDGILNVNDFEPNNPSVDKPVAAFSVQDSYIVNYNVNLNSNSYDPNGYNIVDYEWTVTNPNGAVKTYYTSNISFNAALEGPYTVELIVSNEYGITSKAVKKSFNIIPQPVTGHDIELNSLSGGSSISPGSTENFDLTVCNSGNYTEDVTAVLTVNGPSITNDVKEVYLGTIQPGYCTPYSNAISYTMPGNLVEGYYKFSVTVKSNIGDENWSDNTRVITSDYGNPQEIITNVYKYKEYAAVPYDSNLEITQYGGVVDGGYGPININTPNDSYKIWHGEWWGSDSSGYYTYFYVESSSGYSEYDEKVYDGDMEVFDNGKLLVGAIADFIYDYSGIYVAYPVLSSSIGLNPDSINAVVNKTETVEVNLGAKGECCFNDRFDLHSYNSDSNRRFNIDNDFSNILEVNGTIEDYGYLLEITPLQAGDHDFVAELNSESGDDFFVAGKISATEPPPDTDNDGIIDSSDDFPNDPAASIDSDGDGYPDGWNTGKNQNDSTTGLFLDLHPFDPNANIDSDGDGLADYYDDFPNDSNLKYDSDNDGTADSIDEFPNDPAASIDSDNDGYPDSWNSGYTMSDSLTGLELDEFPDDPAASVDSDGDGYPDQWSAGYSESDSTSGLTLDEFPNDSNEWLDSDNDGYGDNSDQFPSDYSEWYDSDNDGVGDNSDVAPNDPDRYNNSAPIINIVQSVEILVEESRVVNFSVSDPDNDNYTIELLSKPIFASLNGTNINIAPNVGDLGIYTIAISATDSYNALSTKMVALRVVKTFYGDSDGDGYGDPDNTTEDTSQPTGHVTNYGDCNDNDPNINPDITEVLNDGIDNDCDGQVDENTTSCQNDLKLCYDAVACANAGGYWYNAQCNYNKPSPDFDGNSTSDILWNTGSGFNLWYNDTFSNITPDWLGVDTWTYIDSGDYNGDGIEDILWDVGSGYTLWQMHNMNDFTPYWLGVSSWQYVDSGDHNGDGVDDILWNTGSGYNLWKIYGDGSFTPQWLGVNNWTYIDSGDYNGDGIDDILWNTGSGHNLWYMDNNSGFTADWLGVSTWNYVDSGDYNGDGIEDILWYTGSGHNLWYMDNNSGFTPEWLGVGVWEHIDSSDYNGDGIKDILWNTGSGYTLWQMNNMNDFTPYWLGAGNWIYESSGDYDGNGISDIIWNTGSGYNLWKIYGDGSFTPQWLGVGSWSLIE